jgi:nucleoside-diphosphate-sugar epimerase
VTGASGLIGGILLEGLAGSRQIQGLDRRSGQNTDLAVDMRHLSDVAAAFAGVDTVIDLAANPRFDASWEEMYANNLQATINAFEAARRTGVRRVIFASSNHVTGLAERDEPFASIVAGRYEGLDPASVPRLTTDGPIRPDGPYGIAKAMGEATGRYYAEEHGLSVVCLRIGSVNREDRATNPREFSTLLSHRDLVQLVRCAVDAPDTVRFGVYYGASANRWCIWDLDNARRELGYEPLDDAERWR